MDTKYINEMAEYILSIIRMGGSVTWSWGPKSFQAMAYKGMAALRFSVSGFLHKGKVIVSLNAGADCFEVYCVDNKENVLAAKDDVYLNELVEVIDRLIERGDSDAEYDKKRRRWLADNSIKIQKTQ